MNSKPEPNSQWSTPWTHRAAYSQSHPIRRRRRRRRRRHRSHRPQGQQLARKRRCRQPRFAREGQLLVITGTDGNVEVWDLVRAETAGLVWDGTGAALSSPSWYDESSDSIWVSTSGRLLEIPLAPERSMERALRHCRPRSHVRRMATLRPRRPECSVRLYLDIVSRPSARRVGLRRHQTCFASQAENAGSIPVIRSTRKHLLRAPPRVVRRQSDGSWKFVIDNPDGTALLHHE